MNHKNHTGVTRRSLLNVGVASIVISFSGVGFAIPAPSADGHLFNKPKAGSWIKIDSENRITLYPGKVELGQGIETAFVQLVADELSVSPSHIGLVSADTSVSPDEGYTLGSLSIQTSGMQFRRAAAELCSLLRKFAADHFQVPVSDVVFSQGAMHAGGRSVTYGELAALHPYEGEMAVNASDVPQKLGSSKRAVGSSLSRVDIPPKVFGEEAFIHDLKFPNVLHARVVRGLSQTKKLQKLVLDEEALPATVSVVRDGSFTALVGADEWDIIQAAGVVERASVWANGSELPDFNNLVRHISEASQVSTTNVLSTGDQLGLTEGDTNHMYAARYSRPFQAHASISPSIGLACWANGLLTIWSHSQGIFPLRREVAEVLGMDISQIRVLHKDGAGCYGHNGADDAALDAAMIALQVPEKVIRVQWMRHQEFSFEPYGSAMVMDAKASLDEQGKIDRWDYDVWGYGHTYRPTGRGGALLASQEKNNALPPDLYRQLPQPSGGLDRNAIPYYAMQHQRINKHFIAKSILRTSALRGLGAYANVFAIESFMDELAEKVSADPIGFREQHLIDARAVAVLDEVKEMANWGNGGRKPEENYGMGVAFARYKNLGGYIAVIAEVHVQLETAEISLKKVYAAVDCGEVISLDGLRNQVEGGIIQAASWTLLEEVFVSSSGASPQDWFDYPILTFANIPDIQVKVIDRPNDPPLGGGEVAQGPVAAAIANAVYAACGIRLRHLPLQKHLKERVKI